MNVSQKSTKPAGDAPVMDKAEVPDVFAGFLGLFHRSVERAASIEKAALDTITHHAADVNHTMKNAAKTAPAMPGIAIFDFAQQATERMVEAQKGIIDIMVQQSATIAEFAKDRVAYASKAATGVNDLVQQSADRTVAVQKVVLDYAASQNKALADAVKKQAGVAGTPIAAAADSIEKGVDSVIESQKEMLDIATKPLKTVKA